jgi:hypothetical protein
MKTRENIMLVISMVILAPKRSRTVPGTTRGARMVSSSIRARARAVSPLKIETHIIPVIAVGTE